MFFYGGNTQQWSGLGYIDNDFDLGVISYNDQPHHYMIYFNFKTRTHDMRMTTINCRMAGDIAYSFQKQHKQGDLVFLMGELEGVYDPDARLLTSKLHILSFAFVDDWESKRVEMPQISEEKQHFLAQCERLFDTNAPMPTEKQVREARERFLARMEKRKKVEKGK
jgi:hypothetical protein